MSFGMEPDPEFSDRPFVAGTLTGSRAFRLDNLGRLNAVNNYPDSVWLPDENIAVCHRQWILDEGMRYMSPMMNAVYNGVRYGISDAMVPEVYRQRVPTHATAALDCSCGFYAYFDHGDNCYITSDRLLGVIEAYGRVIVGARGFRCSKARIKALIIPTRRPAEFMRVAQNYDGIPIFENSDDAFAAFPLTLPSDLPAPSNTPDFWTRKA